MATAFVSKPQTLVRETGNMFALALEGLRRTFAIKDWHSEYVDQCWFIAKVTSPAGWLSRSGRSSRTPRWSRSPRWSRWPGWSRRERTDPTMFDEVAETDGSEEYSPVRARSIPWPIAAVAGLCMLALVLALVALEQRSQLQRDRNQTTQLKQASGQLVGALTTYDYQHLSEWQKAVLTHATGSFRNGFNDRFASVEKLLTATHNRATSTVQGIYVGDVQGGRASTVVIVIVTVTGLSGTRQFGSYDKLSVLKVNGQWQVDDIETLNFDSTTGSATQGGAQSGSSPSPAPAPTTPSTASK